MATGIGKVVKILGSNTLCRVCSPFSKQNYVPSLVKVRYISSEVKSDERDPAPFFFNPDVQHLLKTLTRVDLKRVFRKRRDGQPLSAPEYKFMTTEQVNQAVEEAAVRAEEKLQMPPVVKVQSQVNEVLSYDPALQGYDSASYVFTDITYGVSNRDRLVVVRTPDGTLRKATLDEHFRLNQLYFPEPGRKMKTPKMFEEEYLKPIFEQGEYEFVLDRACVQFEPDSPDFHRVTAATYEHIDSSSNYECLRSTRHFGPLAFYLAWNKQIDNLLLENIQSGRIDEAASLVRLFHILNPEAKSAQVKCDGQDIEYIQAYLEADSLKKNKVQLALQTHLELQRQKEEVENAIQRAHGHV